MRAVIQKNRFTTELLSTSEIEEMNLEFTLKKITAESVF